MKIVEQLMEALIRQQKATNEVQRLVAEIDGKIDGRGKYPRKPGLKRKPRKKEQP
jgi:hypothetical protein